MGGVDVGGGGKGGRRSLDSEINMIPFIDLLMVTISFLLITAVWSHMARINADAQVPGPPRPRSSRTRSSRRSSSTSRCARPTSSPSSGSRRARSSAPIDVPRKDNLIDEGRQEDHPLPRPRARRSRPSGRPSARTATRRDKKFDQAILHTDNETPYVYIIGVIDAIYQAHRAVQRRRQGRAGPRLQRDLRGQLRNSHDDSRARPAADALRPAQVRPEEGRRAAVTAASNAGLSLTSMIDFLVVTVVFLLMTFSASGETPRRQERAASRRRRTRST